MSATRITMPAADVMRARLASKYCWPFALLELEPTLKRLAFQSRRPGAFTGDLWNGIREIAKETARHHKDAEWEPLFEEMRECIPRIVELLVDDRDLALQALFSYDHRRHEAARRTAQRERRSNRQLRLEIEARFVTLAGIQREEQEQAAFWRRRVRLPQYEEIVRAAQGRHDLRADRYAMPLSPLAGSTLTINELVARLWDAMVVYQAMFAVDSELQELLWLVPGIGEALVASSPSKRMQVRTAFANRWGRYQQRSQRSFQKRQKQLLKEEVRRRYPEERLRDRQVKRQLQREFEAELQRRFGRPRTTSTGWSNSRKHHYDPNGPWKRR